MGVHSGKFAVVDGQSTVRNWQINDNMTPARFVASNTRGGTGRRRGPKSWTGSFGAYGGIPAVMPGEIFAFSGYTAPANDVGGSGKLYQGDAIVDSLGLSWNFQSGELISYQIGFSGHLELTITDGVEADVSDPAAFEPCSAKLEYSNDSQGSSGGSSGFVEWDDIVQVNINITAANASYVNSSTNCWTGRKAGPIDWTMSVTEQNDDRVADREKGEYLDLKMYIDATDFWWLRWGLVRDFTGLTVDRETGNIIQRTTNLDMNGFYGDVGHIKLPGETTPWWPV